MPNPRPYTLLIAVGISPAVLTETVFAIHAGSGRVPSAVHVATTRIGRDTVEALLEGKERIDSRTGQPFKDAEDRWTPFCKDVLGRSQPIDITYHVPSVGSQPLSDVRTSGEDTQFANTCHTLVEELTRGDALPVVGSIAGGRKTMSAHLMTAFSLFGRKQDELTHVLVSDPRLEKPDSTFYYPVPGSDTYHSHAQALDLVRIPFLPIRAVMEDEVLTQLPDDRRDLETLRDVLEPYEIARADVGDVTLVLGDQSARLRFTGTTQGDMVATCDLTPSQAATLLVFAEQRTRADAPLPAAALYDDTAPGPHSVEAQRAAVARCCSQFDTPKPWNPQKSHVSKAFSALKRRLDETPIATRMFAIEGAGSDPRLYDWAGAKPSFTVAVQYPETPAEADWPFDHIAVSRVAQ